MSARPPDRSSLWFGRLLVLAILFLAFLVICLNPLSGDTVFLALVPILGPVVYRYFPKR